jgi:TonB family protein
MQATRRGARVHWLRICSVAGLWILAGADALAAEPAAASVEPTAALAADPKQALEALRQGIWRLYSATALAGKDERGRTIEDDLRETVLPEPVQNRLRELLTQAGTTPPAPGEGDPSPGLAESRRILAEQARNLNFIVSYWSRRIILHHHRDLYLHLAGQLPQPASSAGQARLQSLTAALVACMGGDFDEARLTQAFMALASAYNEERQTLAGLVDQDHDARQLPRHGRRRRSACPAPAQATSGTNRPKLAHLVSPIEFFPTDERRDSVEGKVTLRALIDKTGCVTAAEVVRSSGSPELDDAALDLAEAISYLPAEKEGAAADMIAYVPVIFQLQD